MLLKAVLTWLLLAMLMIVNGTVRELLYGPVVGPYPAHVISTLAGVAIIWCVTWIFLKRQQPVPRNRAWMLGALWLGLTIGFEFPFGHFVDGASWQTLVADYNLLNGRLWLLVLLSTALAPPVCNRHFHLTPRPL